MSGVDGRVKAFAAVGHVTARAALPLVERAQHVVVNWDDFEYPFSEYCHAGDSYPAYPDVDRDDDDIEKVLFAQAGDRDGDAWVLIYKRKDGLYVYFNTWCDYTGYGCQDGTTLEASSDFAVFWDTCLDNEGRLLLWQKLSKQDARENV